MAQVGLGNEQYATGGSVFDLAKLEPKAKDERALIAFPDPTHVGTEYVHTIGGQKFNTQAFGGQFLCLGDHTVLDADGADPANCVLCRRSKEGAPVTAAQQRFVAQVIRYGTDPMGNVVQPLSAQCLVWRFSRKEYQALYQLSTMWGNLQEHDLLLMGESKDFKTWNLNIAPSCYWRSSQAAMDYVWAVWTRDRKEIKDLELVIGKRGNPAEMDAKVNEVMQAMHGGQAVAGVPGMPGMPQGYPGIPQVPQMAGIPQGLPPVLPVAPQPQAPPMVAPPMVAPPQAVPVTPQDLGQPAYIAPPQVAPVPQAPAMPVMMAPPAAAPQMPVMAPPMAPQAPIVEQAPMAAPPLVAAPPAAAPQAPAPEAAGPVNMNSLLQVPTVPAAGV